MKTDEYVQTEHLYLAVDPSRLSKDMASYICPKWGGEKRKYITIC